MWLIDADSRKGFKVIVALWIISDCYLQGFRVIAIASVATCKGFKQFHSFLMVFDFVVIVKIVHSETLFQ